MTSARELAIAHVNREMARMDAADEAARQATRATRRTSGSSVVFSIRLDPLELAAMNSDRVAALVDQLETVVAELRTAVS